MKIRIKLGGRLTANAEVEKRATASAKMHLAKRTILWG